MMMLTICWPSSSLAKSPLFCFVYHSTKSSSVTSTLAFSLSLKCCISTKLIFLYSTKAIESCFGFELGAVLPIFGEVAVVMGFNVLLVVVVLRGGGVGLVSFEVGEAVVRCLTLNVVEFALAAVSFVAIFLGGTTASVSLLRKSLVSYSTLLL